MGNFCIIDHSTAKRAVLDVLYPYSKLLISRIIILFSLLTNNNSLNSKQAWRASRLVWSHVHTKRLIPRYSRFNQMHNKMLITDYNLTRPNHRDRSILSQEHVLSTFATCMCIYFSYVIFNYGRHIGTCISRL